MSMKYVFVLGGVVSGLGKGVTAASLGRLLKARGYNVTMQKFDPYLNVDPGTMDPTINGEVFVTDDGAETVMDLGHYERFVDERLTRAGNVTAGRIYRTVLERERLGDFGGGAVRVIPHITNEIKRRFYRGKDKIAIIEIGGTVGDLESHAFLESIRQFRNEIGKENAVIVLVSLIPYLKASGEIKIKPTQACVRDLQGMGLLPDVLVCRTDCALEDEVRESLAMFCNIPKANVLQNLDAESTYEVPLMLEEEGFAQVVLDALHLPQRDPDLTDWAEMCRKRKCLTRAIDIAVVGKYIKLHDAHLSVSEALRDAGVSHEAQINIHWVDSVNISEENVAEVLGNMSGILIPGGFGTEGIDGMLAAIKYCRENKVPLLGLCLGMQLVVVDYARNVAGLKDAHSIELMPDTPHPIVHLIASREGRMEVSGTLRLGAYPCQLDVGSRTHALYGTDLVYERHRHRYEVNSDYRSALTDAGLNICGYSPDNRIVEMCEITEHPFFIATQAHPEFNSRPNHPHPLFLGFVEAAVKHKNTPLL